jgi:signal transduction histidine kinase/Flp pilus assembly protein TadD
MNKFVCFLFLLLTIIPAPVKAQNKADSLENILLTVEDRKKANIYNQLAKEYYYKNLNKLIFYAQKADSLSKVYEIDSSRIEALNDLCYASINIGKRKQAFEYNKIALNLSEEKNLFKENLYATYFKAYYYYAGGITDSSTYLLNRAYEGAIQIKDAALKLKCLNIIAANYLNKGEYNKALTNFTAAYHIADSLKNKKQLTNLSLNIGTTLLYNENLDQAIEYFEKVIALSDSTNITIAYATAYNNIGACYSRKAQHKKAIPYFEKALPAFKQINNRFQIAQTYANLGQSNYLLNNIEPASHYLNEAVKINRENKLNNQLIVNLIILSRLQVIKKQFNKAKLLLEEASQLSKTYNINYNKSDLFKAYSYYHSNVNNYEKALKYKQLELNFRDSVFNEKKQKQIVELETRFETQLKDKENENLKKDLKLQQLQNTRQKQVRNSLIGFVLLVMLLIGILLNRARIKKQAHLIIEHQKSELEIANSTKDKVFSIIAHDLRSPFTTLIGFSDFLHEEYDQLNESDRKLQIGDIKEAAHNTYNLLDNLLTWSRIQQGRIKMNIQELPLNSIITTSVKSHTSSAKLKGIELKALTAGDIKVAADEFSVALVIGNLLNNAIKFTPQGGNINISSEIHEDKAIVKVKDTGIGLSKIAAEKIFKVNEIYSSKGTNEEKGSGLGLILCKEFIEMNNGEIWLCNEHEKGACFAFSLPLHKA